MPVDAIGNGSADLIGLARGLALDPNLANSWRNDNALDPDFPQFSSSPEGGITAWYTMRLTQIGEDRESENMLDLQDAIAEYEERDNRRVSIWLEKFR